MPVDSAAETPSSTVRDYQEDFQRSIASLDATLRTTFGSLQQDLSSYQSSLSQQLHQMYNLEQQAEVILETLVNRLRAEIPPEPSEIQQDSAEPCSTQHSAPSMAQRPPEVLSPSPAHPPLSLPELPEYLESDRNSAIISYPSGRSLSLVPPLKQTESPATIAQPLPQPLPFGKRLIGFVLVLLSLLALSLENVVVSIIFNLSPTPRLSASFGGFMVPTVGNSLLLLWLRMLVMVPLMAILATGFYPLLWRDIQQFLQAKNWRLFGSVLSSGFFLFLSQVLIYLALGSIAPGIAVTIFFIYPILPLLFGDRFSRLSSLAIFSMVIGGFILITLPSTSGGHLSGLGIMAASGSAIAFAVRLILIQTSAKKLHPIPLLWLNLAIVLVFSALSLVLPLPASWHLDVEPTLWPKLVISGLVLGGTAILGYVLNHMGIARIGAASASILGATLPALTALLALILMHSSLEFPQIIGMLLVSLGVAALSFERSRRQSTMSQSANRLT
ncbi:MAG TPA: hypothetical protein DDZ80_26670 [Cyanobacteria bacterium UBA8803]|nr:hypothetical protein [Cyanobacteria bacterium UBA8803]